MASWQLQEAKAKFSEVIDTAEKKGPQIVTRHGTETVVIVPIEQWKRLQALQSMVSERDELTDQQWRDGFLAFLRSSPDFEIPDRHRERLEQRKARRQHVSA
jgi:prevent-host-death family protein